MKATPTATWAALDHKNVDCFAGSNLADENASYK
jgi:hypothetical protein